MRELQAKSPPESLHVVPLAPPHLRGASFGLRQSLDTIGGPLLAIDLMWLTADRFQTVFWIAVAPAFLSFALILVAVKEPERPKELPKVGMPLHRRELGRLGADYWRVVAIARVFTLARFSEAFLILRAQSIGLPLALVPIVMVIMNLAYALSAYPVGILSDRIDRVTILIFGLALLILADLVLAYSAGILGVGIGVVLWGLHMGFTQGPLSALVADTAPAELRGTAFGMFNLVTGVPLLLASVVAGALWDVAGPQATFLVGAAFAETTVVGLFFARGRLKKPDHG